METHNLDYSAEAALADVSTTKALTAQKTHMSLPWWLYALIAATWPILAISPALNNWVGVVIPGIWFLMNMIIIVVLVARLSGSGVVLSVTLSIRRTPWVYIGLAVLGLASTAMMPLTDMYNWPSWYAIVVGVVAGLLTFVITMWFDRRTTAELNRSLAQIKTSA